ncbi:MAG TPA: hypothetical protein VFW24_05040 [Acidimicrobiales bacterium]|nr:hypothetical protein [Acidimicrobiales bacterium]
MSDRISGWFDSALGRDEKKALAAAVDWTQQQVALADGGRLDMTLVEFLIENRFLPTRYRHRYDAAFLDRFLLVLDSVIGKLGGQDPGPLESTAQELALHGLLETAEVLAEPDEELDFDLFRNIHFEDLDHEFLFHPAFDGVEDDTTHDLNFANLRYEDWFKPFRP